jgi:enoyl-CoA hydratase
MTATAEVRVERQAHVLTITIDRPEALNAMTRAVGEAIAVAADELDGDPELRVGVLTGAGKAFCAGMDLKRFAQGEVVSVPGRGFGGLTARPPAKPLIAAVEGWALGGGFELALACDLIVAGASARFGLPEVRRGLVARAGGLMRLPRRIPQAIALEMILLGEPIGAVRAAELGLINRVVPDGDALRGAVEMAQSLAACAPLSVKASKAVALDSRDWVMAEAFERQAPYTDAVMTSADAMEGALAFTQRRAPVWRAE